MMAAVEAAPTQFFEVEDGVKLAYRVLGRQDGRAVPLVLVQGLCAAALIARGRGR